MTSLLTPQITIGDDHLEIRDLKITNSDVVSYFKNSKPSDYLEELQKALEIGILVLSRVNTVQTVDFFNVKISELLNNVQTHFAHLDGLVRELLIQSLDPSKNDSFLARTQNVITTQVERVNVSLLDVVRDARNLLIAEAEKIQNGRESLDKKMDPSNSSGYLASLIQRMNDFERKLNTQFSDTDSASFVGKLKQIVAEHFGAEGKVLQLIDKKLMLDPEGKTPLSQIYFGLKGEIASLRDLTMKLAGQQELLNATTQKGYPFEDKVFDSLQKIAHPFGDVVEDTSLKVEAISGSKKGDYVYKILDTKQSVVLDAKNYNKLKSLTAMLDYLKIAMQERNCRFGIIVAPDIASLQKQVGSWNVYDNCIITPIDFLEMSIKYAKFSMQFQEASSKNINPSLIRQKLNSVERKMKEVTNLKTKLTKLNNGVTASVADIQDCVESLRHDIQQLLQEIFTELNK